MKKNRGHACTFDQIQALVDGSLPGPQAREVAAHIDTCAECRALAGKLRSLDALTARSEQAAAPDGYFETFGSRVASRIAAHKTAPESRGFRWPLWGVVPLAAAAGLVLVIALRQEPPGPHLAIHLPPATRLGTAAPDAPVVPGKTASPAPIATAMAGGQSADRLKSTVVGEPGLAATSPAPEAAPAAPASAAEQASDRDERKEKSSASDQPALAAKRSSSADKSQIKEEVPSPVAPVAPVATVAPPSPAVQAVPSGPTVVLRLDNERAPRRVGSAKDLQGRPTPAAPAAPAALAAQDGPVRVIVIRLPDGSSYCPAPDSATAIEIRLPPGGAEVN